MVMDRSKDNSKQNAGDVDAQHVRTPSENEKLRRNRKERERGMGPKNFLPAQNAPGLNEKEGEDEMEDLYREEENRGRVEAV
ncbi:MAG: hypothetical protein COV74_00940 [Candidatus Omnitrophica bacterium CG11_big_fil_rev_8_21_14_0_20_45_26]|uniref:Uncharacterized protein n=1 Tax=Candidatus Abzuiibacterium crystallinum TaxID=1974748 RepID=A0A2H0LSJ1_9BACT|nr:MAG: hypothetical protein COV74_00940 [Candidatus Omnitrophica bacterium CG11_big_fil_rev_8_21_14_0_20_45_26]